MTRLTRRPPCRSAGVVLAALALALAGGAAAQGMSRPAAPAADEFAFERMVFKDRFDHEVRFRAAAVQVAWSAEALCDRTAQIEPVVLLSQHALRKRLSERDSRLYREATGMDDRWRVVWADEDTPDDLRLLDAVVAINGRPLPGSGTRVEMGAVFRGGSVVSQDDQGFWDVLLKAREEAAARDPPSMTLTLADGRRLQVNTQAGCAGAVTASASDPDPAVFWRQGNTRVKIPALAMLEARTRDEFRWLAAFGTFYQASRSAIERVQQSQGVSTGFAVGKVLTLAVPGSGMLLSAVEAQTEKALAVTSIAGSADLFANEVVVSMGGDVEAGLRLNRRMAAKGLQVEGVLMDAFRLSTAVEHVRRIRAIQAAQARAEAEQAREQEERQRQALTEALPVRP